MPPLDAPLHIPQAGEDPRLMALAAINGFSLREKLALFS
jgi:hypothetical protein